jgi:ribonucleoside-diphosphate reductase alpha chain
VLDENGFPVSDMGVLEAPAAVEEKKSPRYRIQAGKTCEECGNAAVIHRDGCEFCTACGAVGSCG